MTDQAVTKPAAATMQLELEVSINAPRQQVWQAFMNDIGMWWPRDFHVSESGRMRIEAFPGGRMLEESGESAGGTLWGTVLSLYPPESFALCGHLTPRFGGPATSILELRFEAAGEKATLLKISDAWFGHIGENTRKNVSSGWRSIFEGGLKRFVEQGQS